VRLRRLHHTQADAWELKTRFSPGMVQVQWDDRDEVATVPRRGGEVSPPRSRPELRLLPAPQQ
jgi:hypothetical protein